MPSELRVAHVVLQSSHRKLYGARAPEAWGRQAEIVLANLLGRRRIPASMRTFFPSRPIVSQEINMTPSSNIRISLFRATHTSSNAHVFGSPSPSRAKRRLVGVVAVMLLIAVPGVLAHGQVDAGAPDSAQPNASTVARARAAFLKYMSSHRPRVHSVAPPLAASEGSTSAPATNWAGFADVEGGSNTISSVSGQWVIPYVQCPSGNYRYQDAF